MVLHFVLNAGANAIVAVLDCRFASAVCPGSSADAKVPQAGNGSSGIAQVAISDPHPGYGLMRMICPVPIEVLLFVTKIVPSTSTVIPPGAKSALYTGEITFVLAST